MLLKQNNSSGIGDFIPKQTCHMEELNSFNGIVILLQLYQKVPLYRQGLTLLSMLVCSDEFDHH